MKNIFKNFLVAALFMVVDMPFGAQKSMAEVFNPESFMLDNGMQVVVISNHRAPVISHMVWYKTGAADELRGVSGIAHFLEHLMFKETETLEAGEFSQIIAREGGRDNAFTNQDYTGYYQNIASNRLEMVMRMEAERMRGLHLTEEVIAAERDVIIEERNMRTDNNPSARLREMVNYALYVNHPYGTPVIGWRHEMEGLTLADAQRFYERWYTPENAILVVAGDVTGAEVLALAEEIYGVIPRNEGAEIARVRRRIPVMESDILVSLRDEQVSQPYMTRAWIAPVLHGEGGEHAAALQVLSEIMGGGSTSRLYRSMVIEQELAVSAGFSYSGGALDIGTLSLYAVPREGEELDDMAVALMAEISLLLEEGLDDDEVERAKRRLQDGALFAQDSLNWGANALGAALTSGRTIEDVESWPQRIGSVTNADIMAAAAYIFEDTAHVTGYLLPLETEEVE